MVTERVAFDVSQTEGKPLPAIGRVQGDALHYGEKLIAYTHSLGIRLEYSQAIAPARGVSEGGKITLLPDLDSAEHAAVLAHELAHELLHHQPRRAATSKAVRETEAVAHVVCQALGLSTGTASTDYIQLSRRREPPVRKPQLHPLGSSEDSRRNSRRRNSARGIGG